jgi:uroporphyrinogen-III synthase
MRVFVTRPASEARPWVEELRRHGFEAIAFPLIAILPPTDAAPLRTAWQQLQSYRAAMFVSGNAVRHFFAEQPAAGGWPTATRAWATGAGTRGALLQAGVPAACIDTPPPDAAQFDSETLWPRVAAQVQPGDCVLIVRGGDAQGVASGRDWLAGQVSAAGAMVETAVAYRRAPPALEPQQLAWLRAGAAAGVWLFSSSEAVAHLVRLLPLQEWQNARALATHPRIAEAARRAGFGVVCESRPPLEAVIAVLESIR